MIPTLPRYSARRTALLVACAIVSSNQDADAQRRGAGREREREAPSQADRRETLRVGGDTRTYLLRVPTQLSRSSAPAPLVIVLHGGGGNAANAEAMTGFTALVERERIVVAYPDGSSPRRRSQLHTWNADHCCGHAMESEIDDVAFLNALIDRISASHPIDPSRIYVTGMSNGGMMSHRVGRELSKRIAAIAPVVGAVFGDEVPPPQPVSAIMINGLLDKSVPADGGLSGGLGRNNWDGTPTKPNLDQGTFWARSNGCTLTPTRTTQGAIITSRFACPAGIGVEVHQLSDNGHAWPGGSAGSRRGDPPSTAMNATEVIWAFFKAHPKTTARR
jgi:polyhydroxybutyrate depolymerase